MAATAMVKRVTALDAIISAEFDEMPGMRLTLPQVCRLWSLTTRQADDLIGSLVDRGVLALDRRGRVYRPEDQVA